MNIKEPMPRNRMYKDQYSSTRKSIVERSQERRNATIKLHTKCMTHAPRSHELKGSILTTWFNSYVCLLKSAFLLLSKLFL